MSLVSTKERYVVAIHKLGQSYDELYALLEMIEKEDGGESKRYNKVDRYSQRINNILKDMEDDFFLRTHL